MRLENEDGVNAEMLEALRRNRVYAGFFEWSPNRDLAECSVVESLAKSLDSKGKLFFCDLTIRGRGNDPPDLEAIDATGRRIAIEVTELVDENAIRAHKMGRTREIAEWGRQPFLDGLQRLLLAKNGRCQFLRGGPYPGGYVVVIHTDETFLNWVSVEDHLKGQVFKGLPHIDRAFLLLSYVPGKNYPCFELTTSG